MDNIVKKFLYTGKNKDRYNLIWNMAGSFCYAMASMVLTFLVMKMIGENQGGIFSFAYSTVGQQMFLIAYFGIRPFHITDGANQYSFADYFRHRIITCIIAVITGLFYLFIQGYEAYKFLIIFLMILYKTIDGLADVFESEFQRSGNLYLTGKSNTFRTLLSVAVFLGTLWTTRNLVIACAAAVGAQVMGVICFDWIIIGYIKKVNWDYHKGSCIHLFQNTMLLFFSVFLDFYIFSSSKYAVDARMTNAASGYFNLIFMPTSVINLAAGFVIRPFLTVLTQFWNEEKYEAFRNLTRRIIRIISLLTLLAVGVTMLFGTPVLRLLEKMLGIQYKDVLTPYSIPFVLIVLGGGFYAVMNLMYYVLVIMRKQKEIFCLYGGVAGIGFFLSGTLVSRGGIFGAAWNYLILMILLAVAFGVVVIWSYQASIRSWSKDNYDKEK